MSSFVQFIKNNSTFKLLLILFLILIMMIPLTLAESMINERISMRDRSENSIAKSWGSAQVISGPVLKIPYKARLVEKEKLKNGQEQVHIRYERHHIYLLSDTLKIDTKLETEKRYLGIYEMPVYISQSSIKAQFSHEDLLKINNSTEQVLWQQAQLILPFSDVKGIRELTVEDGHSKQTLKFTPYHSGNLLNGIISDFPIDITSIHTQHESDQKTDNNISLDLNLRLAGSKSLNFRPFGRKTDVTMTADWNNPSFDGQFLPASRKIDEQGFTASWQVLELNRNFPQQWTNKNFNRHALTQSNFGVKLYQPVNLYQQNKRSIKYAILFIALTYMSFFLIEIIFKNHLHSLQYFFTGGALSTFYLLLIAFSEHVGFSLAYFIATISISLLMMGYSISIFKNRLRGVDTI